MRRLFVIALAGAFVGSPPAQGASIDWEALCKRGTAKVVTELTVGGGDEESEEEPPFLKPYDVAVANDGSFYVLDGDGVIIHFGPDGAEVNRFAREGEGPGELRRPYWIEIDAKGRIVVYEVDNHRFSFFQPNGTFIETKPQQDFVTAFACSPDGRIIMNAAPDEMMSPDGKRLQRIMSFDEQLAHPVVIDSLRSVQFHVSSTKTSMTSYSVPFRNRIVFCVLADGSTAWGRIDRYEIHVVGPDLKPNYTLRRDIPPPQITAADREEYFKDFESSGPEFVAMVKRDVEWPKHKPFFDDLFTYGDFLIAVRAGTKKTAPQLDVFRRDRFLGTVSVAEFRSPRTVHDGRFFRTFRDSDRLPSVMKYRIE